jgi:hypothetical protein
MRKERTSPAPMSHSFPKALRTDSVLEIPEKVVVSAPEFDKKSVQTVLWWLHHPVV